MGGTAYIDRKDAELRLDGSALAVYVNGEREGVIPLVPLDRLVLIGNLTVETKALHRLNEEGVAVLFLSGKRQAFRGRLMGRLHRHARLRTRQYEQRQGALPLELARGWVGRKLAGQEAFLRDAAVERPEDRSILLRSAEIVARAGAKAPEAASVESLRGLEGGAAAAYFDALPVLFPPSPPSLEFAGRGRRPPRDPVNALLSLTYTMVHWEWVRECELIGLDPMVGLYHDLDYGRESLACDLVEPVRPDVDRWVWELCRTRAFEGRDFSSDGERPGCYLKKGARGRFYEAYEGWAGPRRSAMRAETEALARRILDGEDPLFLRTSGDAGDA
ncbi:MAG: CRISPR-associated endonuclease Cas1 [Nitrospirae bacterium]|nr:CRISPR-associated endonuclease Cas1 [Nitrospirota bacterium]